MRNMHTPLMEAMDRILPGFAVEYQKAGLKADELRRTVKGECLEAAALCIEAARYPGASAHEILGAIEHLGKALQAARELDK
jgi:hypothetical protein